MAWHPDGDKVATFEGKRVVVYDAETRERVQELEHGGREGQAISWSADGSMLAIGLVNPSATIVLDAKTGEWKEIAKLARHSGPIDCVSFSPNGRILATAAGDNSVGLWNTKTWKPHGAILMLPKSRLAMMADGHYRGTPDAEKDIVMVALTEDGQQLTLTPAEFAERFGWKNDPSKVTLTPAE